MVHEIKLGFGTNILLVCIKHTMFNTAVHIFSGWGHGISKPLLRRQFNTAINIKVFKHHSVIKFSSARTAFYIVLAESLRINGQNVRVNWSYKNHNPATLFQQLIAEGDRNIFLINNWPHYVVKWSGPGVPYEAHPQWPVANTNGPYWPWMPVPSTIPPHHPGHVGYVMVSNGPIVPNHFGMGPAVGNAPGRNWQNQVGVSRQVYAGNRRYVAGHQVAPIYPPPIPQMHAGPFMLPAGNQMVGPMYQPFLMPTVSYGQASTAAPVGIY